ncbi:MAG: hypothetical protein ABJP66_25640, partial [Hyphomicrobiales bacterium]
SPTSTFFPEIRKVMGTSYSRLDQKAVDQRPTLETGHVSSQQNGPVSAEAPSPRHLHLRRVVYAPASLLSIAVGLK